MMLNDTSFDGGSTRYISCVSGTYIYVVFVVVVTIILIFETDNVALYLLGFLLVVHCIDNADDLEHYKIQYLVYFHKKMMMM